MRTRVRTVRAYGTVFRLFARVHESHPSLFRPSVRMGFATGGMRLSLLLALGLMSRRLGAAGIYLPGVAPQDFVDGEELKIKMDKLTSVQSQIPFSFYHLSFCTPTEAGIKDVNGNPQMIENVAENLGEVLAGDRMETSPFQISMRRNKGCTVVCRKLLTPPELVRFVEFITKKYRVNMWLDNLPVAERSVVEYIDPDTGAVVDDGNVYYQTGFPLGFDPVSEARQNPAENVVSTKGPRAEQETHLRGDSVGLGELTPKALHNHLAFVVRYHEPEYQENGSNGGARIVGQT